MKTFYACSMVLLFWAGFPQHPFLLSGLVNNLSNGTANIAQWTDDAVSAEPKTPVQLVSGQLLKTGNDALLLVKSGANIQTIYALQEAQGRFESFALQSAHITSSDDGVSIQLSGGLTYCMGIANDSQSNSCSQLISGVGFAQIQFTKSVDYERVLYLLNAYQSLIATLQHINKESQAGMAIPPQDDADTKSCLECGAGGLGAKGCSVESDTFSCSVSCNSPYYACCSILGGCRCCK